MKITIKITVASAKITNTPTPAQLSLAIMPRPTCSGRPAMMPPKMMMDTPLPMPRSVISSPSQTHTIVPAVSDAIMATVSSAPACNTPPWLRSSCNWANPCNAASGTVSQCVIWFTLLRPDSPSSDSLRKAGITGTSSCMMMDEVI